MSKSKIIAIVGMCGSGKSVAGEYFNEQGIKGIYFGRLTLEEVEKRGLDVNPENERKVREELRARYGMAAYAQLSLKKIEILLSEDNTSCIYIDGLYSFEEYEVLDQQFPGQLVLVEIFTNKSLRYQRLSERLVRPLTPTESKERDIAEIKNLNKGGPIALADYKLENNGSVEELRKKLATLHQKITS